MPFNMNKQRGAHMAGKSLDDYMKDDRREEAPAEPAQSEGGSHIHHFAIHSHDGGHEVHITHPDGQHEHHHHEAGDSEGIAAHIHQHLGGHGQDHGGSSGAGEENEHGYGSGV